MAAASRPRMRCWMPRSRSSRCWAAPCRSIFLGVAAFLLNVVVTRLVSTQREQIAALKALGYPNRSVAAHYLKLVGVIVLLGLVLGLWLGQVLGSLLAGLYAEFFRFPAFACASHRRWWWSARPHAGHRPGRNAGRHRRHRAAGTGRSHAPAGTGPLPAHAGGAMGAHATARGAAHDPAQHGAAPGAHHAGHRRRGDGRGHRDPGQLLSRCDRCHRGHAVQPRHALRRGRVAAGRRCRTGPDTSWRTWTA
jgi:hypothetical protein